MRKLALFFTSLVLVISIFVFLKPSIFKRTLIKVRNTLATHKYKDLKVDNNSVWGIDISHHQGNIDWDKFEKSKPAFIFLKATEGTTHRDTKYKEYKERAEDLSIVVGAYHFFNYYTNGKQQAKNFLNYADLTKGNLPPVLDAEFKSSMPPKQKVQNELMAFINHIEMTTGEKPIIYCEADYYNKYLKSELNGNYPLWISDFWREPSCNYMFWQKTDKFKHPAFKGTIDYNIFRGTIEQLNELTMK